MVAAMAPIDLHTTHYFGEGIYAKRMRLPAGHRAVTHKHNYDHLSILAAGSASVDVGGEMTIYGAGDCVTIKAGVAHEIVAITDVVWFCIHATDETDPEKVDRVLIQEG